MSDEELTVDQEENLDEQENGEELSAEDKIKARLTDCLQRLLNLG